MVFRTLLGLIVLVIVPVAHGTGPLPAGIRSPVKDVTRQATLQAFSNYIHQVYQPAAEKLMADDTEASWKYNTNITDHNEQEMIASSEKAAKFDKDIATHLRATFRDMDFSGNQTLKRIYDILTVLGDANLNEADFKQLQEVEARMKNIYSTAKICRLTNVHADNVENSCPTEHQLELEPGITQIIQSSRNETLLKHVWKSWRDATGKKMRTDYRRYVDLKNKGARMDGYEDNGAAWRSTYVEPILGYNDQDFIEEAEAIWQQLRPLYEQLHGYVRYHLRRQYPEARGINDTRGPIPAHLLGNMWAQQWSNLQEFSRPHPDKPSLDVSDAMVAQGYNATQMFHMSDDFFASLGLIRMPQEFWDHSMLQKPADRKVVCHASAWDFYNRKDFRIKQCTDIRMKDFITVHHEMGHVEYYLQYKDLEVPLRRGTNDGFHEAVGDTLALSVQTPSHLKSLGLLLESFDVTDPQLGENSLYSMALEKIAFLPFGYLMDKYRYDIFSGKIKPEQYNAKWWEYLVEYQGICAPVKRTEDDFDAGAKFHVPSSVPYMRYFVSFVIQFQFHEAMCEEAGYKGDLHRCDISAPELGDGGKKAGALLAKTLKIGSSQPWQYGIGNITKGRTQKMDARPLLKFFKPMQEWLTRRNQELGVTPGWNKDPDCSADKDFSKWMSEYNTQASIIMTNDVTASWNYQVHITDENEKAMLAASAVSAQFTQFKAKEMKRNFMAEDLLDAKQTRVLNKLGKLGDAALNQADFGRLGELKSQMEKTYSTAKVCKDRNVRLDIAKCPKDKQLELEPEIKEILDKSRDPEEMKYLWHAWRDATGKEIRKDYISYIELKNKAAVADGYMNTAEVWRAPYVEPAYNYSDADFLKEVKTLWEQMKPLYADLHAYIRIKLRDLYGEGVIKKLDGPIPAHLLSNMWGQTWLGLLDDTQPFKGKPALDVSKEMQNQKWDADKMFKISDKFFTDLGLIPMPQEFWNKSMLTKPNDREVVCHASAWDFYNGKDFRIKQCTAVNMQDLFTVHHEMGHVEYFLQYKDKWIPFRDGANDGFHEAVGDTLALSVSTPGHLQKLDLLKNYDVNDRDAAINFMYSTALEKIAFLPFGLVMDMYRYDVFNGLIKTADLNKKWWDYVAKYQGICSPVERNEIDFDPGAKYHTAADVPYMRYFVSFVIQFQFHEALCRASGHTGELHTCDIDGSKAAGKLMADALSLGSSEPWQVAMKKLTGQEKMDARPLLKFFEPLQTWLRTELEKRGQKAGWSEDPICASGSPDTSGVSRVFGSMFGFVAFFILFLVQ